MHGPIYDESLLAQKYAKALVCVSPTQAGLTVPKSMGYGVPVITRRDAITGGELYHITSDENGILYDKDEDLVLILKQVIGNPEFAKTMGRKAKDYYQNNATPRHQAQGVIAAIEFALNSNR